MKNCFSNYKNCSLILQYVVTELVILVRENLPNHALVVLQF